VAKDLQGAALRWLAERGEWQTFVNHYDPALNFTELDCLYGQYQLSHGLTAEGNATAEKLWLVGKSQPEACDRLFERWASTGQLSEAKRWQRAKLAAEAAPVALLVRLDPDAPRHVETAERVELGGACVPLVRLWPDSPVLPLRAEWALALHGTD